MDRSARDSRRAAGRVEEAAARAENARRAKALRDAAQLTGGVNSPSGGVGGGVSTNDTLLNGDK